MNVCPVCGAKSKDGLMCRADWSQLARDLRTVPALLADLDTAAAKQARLTPPTPGGLASERNPIDWTPAVAHAELHLALTTSAQRIAPHRANRYTTTAAATLLEHQHALRAHPAAPGIHERITHAVARARKTIDRPEHRAVIDVGPCPECPGHLRAYIPHDDTPARVTCTTDPTHQWTADQWLRLGRRILATGKGA